MQESPLNINYYRSTNFYTLRFRNGEIRIVKYLYVEITIVNLSFEVVERAFLPSVGF